MLIHTKSIRMEVFMLLTEGDEYILFISLAESYCAHTVVYTLMLSWQLLMIFESPAMEENTVLRSTRY